MTVKDYEVVTVGGYGWSGSSAVVDLFKDTEYFHDIEGEFRLIQDPDGIIDLETSLTEGWTYSHPHAAITRFERFLQSLDRHFDYNRKSDGKFFKYSEKYLSELVDFKYDGFTAYTIWNKEKPTIVERVLQKIGKNKHEIHYTKLEKETFHRITKNYLDNIIQSLIPSDDLNWVVLDGAFNPHHLKKSNDYLKQSKAILVDRDPRDTYIDAVDSEWYPTESIEQFSKFYLDHRDHEDYSDSEQILEIQFEELVLNSDSVTDDISNFLSCQDINISNKNFDPTESKENIRMYKDIGKYTKEFNYIEEKLYKYCY